MKTILTLKLGPICLFLLLPFFLAGQTISEQIGGVITKFVIKSDALLLNSDKQILIEKGIKNFSYSSCDGFGYGYGYQGLHLEFVSNEEIQLQYRKKKGLFGKRNFYYLFLKDGSGDIYKEIFLGNSNVQRISSDQLSYAYSINLDDIPLILLDDLVEINIIKIEER